LLPHLVIAMMGLMAAMSIALSFARMDAVALFRACALVQAFPVVMGVVLGTLQEKHPTCGTRATALFSRGSR
jgi:hypothetical protein